MTRRLIGGEDAHARTVASARVVVSTVSHAHARTVHGRADAAVFPPRETLHHLHEFARARAPEGDSRGAAECGLRVLDGDVGSRERP